MAAKPASKQLAPRYSSSPTEKRRIVELTLREGASLVAIAREHGVHPNNLYQRKAIYGNGNSMHRRSSRCALPAGPRTRTRRLCR
jgi:transposase-like protein